MTGLLKGILSQNKKAPQSEQIKLINGGDELKYRGITIIKRKDCNTWCARYRKNGKQYYISARTQQDCYNKLKKALNRKTKNETLEYKPKQKEPNGIIFNKWVAKWIELYKQNVKSGTLKEYQVCLNHLEELKNKPINKITSIDIIEQLNKIKGERTKQKVYEFANGVFNKAVLNELINKNPMQAIDKPKHIRVNGKALTNKDETKVEQILINKKMDMFLVCLYQGLRKGEMLALTSKDIDFENKTLSINKNLNKDNLIDTTKNIYSNRVVPLFDKTIQILEKYKNINGRIFNYTQRKCEKEFEKVINELGVKYTIHSLRHTFITKCQEKNIPLHIIQRWVGHNIGSKVTNTVYTHARELAELENIEKMNI